MDQLQGSGLSATEIAWLVLAGENKWREVMRLIEKGCDPSLAFRIVR